jgi:hypothetical protein
MPSAWLPVFVGARCSDRLVAWRGGHSVCPRRDRIRGIDIETFEFFALTCGANVCPFCIETNIWLTGRAFELSEPERYAVFTGLSGDWAVDRVKIKSLHKWLDRHGYAVNSAYTIEQNPKLTGFHLNFWWHGDYVSQAYLSEAAVRLGWGPVVHVKRWRTKNRAYGLKEASGSEYGMKEAAGSGQEEAVRWTLTERQAGYLSRNGGRLLGARRSFWRDGLAGEALGSKKAAIRASFPSSESHQGPRSQWVVFGGSEVLAHSPVTSPFATDASLSRSGSLSTAQLPLPG